MHLYWFTDNEDGILAEVQLRAYPGQSSNGRAIATLQCRTVAHIEQTRSLLKMRFKVIPIAVYDKEFVEIP